MAIELGNNIVPVAAMLIPIVGSIALFSFLAVSHWVEARRKERESYYKNETLKKIADQTGGRYYRADTAETLRKIYADIDRLETTEVEVKKYQHYDELFGQVAIAGLALLALEMILGQTVWRKLP